MADDNCMAARPADGAKNNMLVDDDSDDYYFDWEKIVHETETAEDDSSDFDMEEDEEVPSDDDLSEYVISDDDDDDGWERHDIVMLPRGYDMPDASQKRELSEDSKALLFWRDEENGNNFSDWKIKVEALKSDCDGCSEGTVTMYNVHRLTLAKGPKKSGYFEALLHSDCYSESSDRMSTVQLPEMVAKQFPDFLDYLYAQPQDSNVVITFENWESMKYLADYFLVPRLTEAVAEFVEEDMKYFNPDHMEKYISEFNRDISSDMSRRILPMAVRTCAEMFQSIDDDSPLLKSIPPAMFRSIIRRIYISEEQSLESRQNAALHTCSLIASYFDHAVEDIEVFGFCCESGLGYFLFIHMRDKSDDRVMDLALTWFRLMAKKGWNEDKVENKHTYGWARIKSVEHEIGRITKEYLRSKTLSYEIMEKIVKDAPCWVVTRALKESLDEARRLRESQGQARP